MQLFLVDLDPVVAASLLCDENLSKGALEATQVAYTAVRKRNCLPDDKPKLPDGTELEPYLSTHKNHPCTRWVSACPEHFRWCIEHGLAICDVWEKRFKRETNCKHRCWYHLDHLLTWMNSMPDLLRMNFPEEPTGPYGWVEGLLENGELNEAQAEELLDRCASINPPRGCRFGILAMPPEFRERPDGDDRYDCVLSYKKYYVHKACEGFPMTWSNNSLKEQMRTAFETYSSGRKPLTKPETKAAAKKREAEARGVTPATKKRSSGRATPPEFYHGFAADGYNEQHEGDEEAEAEEVANGTWSANLGAGM